VVGDTVTVWANAGKNSIEPAKASRITLFRMVSSLRQPGYDNLADRTIDPDENRASKLTKEITLVALLSL
jgi:hypothetical protein